MKKNVPKRGLSFILAFVMIFSTIPFVANAESTSNTYATNDYTPFLIETANGKAVYNTNTADMSYNFYLAARSCIDNYAGNNLYPVQDGDFSFGYNGNTYIPESVYFSKPQEYPSCGLLTGVLNYEVDNSVKHIVLIAFRGSDKIEDWITDVYVITGDDGYHEGFEETAQKHYESMINTVEYSLGNGESISFSDFVAEMKSGNDDYTMIITGHSLGAGVAGVFTSKYLDNRNSITSTNAVAYTFASPLTCSDAQAAKESTIVKNVFNIVNTDDIVTKVGANVSCGERTGYDLKWKLGKYGSLLQNWKGFYENMFDLSKFLKQYKKTFSGIGDNHHMGTAYLPTKNYINSHINEYTDTFVLYNNYDEDTHTYQRIVFNNGQLILSGSGMLSGDWNQSTLVEWAKVKDSCTALVFATDCAITEIGDYAFSGMTQLTNELDLPDTITKIGNYAFFHCGFNGDLIIPAGMKEVGISAFNGCSNLDSINAQEADSMTWGYGAFANCVYEDYLILPIEDLGVDLKKDIFSTYYVEDNSGIYKIAEKNSTFGNVVLPGDKIYYGRLLDEQIGQCSTFDFHYFLTEGNVDTQQSIEAQSKTTIENVASIDEFGCITVSPSCEANKEFTVVVLYDSKGDPNYIERESTYYIHFTVGTINDKFAGGIGTKERPYLIKNSDQLKRIKDDLSACYKLIADINFNGETISPLGTLTGSLDGNGYAIYGFNISTSNAGLFSEIAKNAQVKNLMIGKECGEVEYTATISSDSKAGALTCVNSGEIENCSVVQVKIETSAHYDWGVNSTIITISGGIAAENYCTIKSCSIELSTISASSTTTYDNNPARCEAFSGAIIGINRDGGVIKDLSSWSNIILGYTYSKDKGRVAGDGWATNQGRGYTYCGGIVSYSVSNTLESSYSYNNDLRGTRDSDDGTTQNKPFVATGTTETTNCVEQEQDTVINTSSINVDSCPHKRNYYIGESLNLFGLVIEDNKNPSVNGYTVSGFDSNKSGEQTIKVSYQSGYNDTPLTTTFTVNVENIIPQSVIVRPQESLYNINTELSVSDFTAIIYYNNGTTETMESLAENESDIVKFTTFTNLLDTKGAQVLQLNYHYAYMNTDGKAVVSASIVAYVVVNVNCDCLSTITLNAVPPTVLEYGYTGDLACSVCQSIVEEGTIVDICDINDDGVLNSKDTARLMRYLAGYDVDVIEAALDVNGDGAVNSKDTTCLMRYLAGWEVELH